MSSYDRRTRDRYRQVVTGVTGVAGLGALTLTGGLMGLAAGEAAQEQEDQDADQVAQQDQVKPQRGAGRRSPLRERPYVTRVTTKYVTGGTVTSSDPGPGGTVSGSSGSSGSSDSSDSAPPPAPAPEPAPAPDPPPAPSSGS